MAILKGHLNSELDLDMRPFRTKTKGMSGADLEQLARDARRLARRERVTVEYRHVNAYLPHRVRRSDDQMYRVAVHEIGHAVIGAILNFAPLDHVFVERDYIPNSGDTTAGGAAFQIDNSCHQDQKFFDDRICVYVAAMACEQMMLGSHADGVISDLEEATNTATFALGSVGMGDTMSSYGLRDAGALAHMRLSDPLLGRRVEQLLQEQLGRARGILEANREVVDFLITELLKHNCLPGSVVYGALQVDQPAMNFG